LPSRRNGDIGCQICCDAQRGFSYDGYGRVAIIG
jgi:hypothetical protein